MISLKIDRDISVSKDAFCYDVDFWADCECGNKLEAKHSFNKESLEYTCSDCGRTFTFTVKERK